MFYSYPCYANRDFLKIIKVYKYIFIGIIFILILGCREKAEPDYSQWDLEISTFENT